MQLNTIAIQNFGSIKKIELNLKNFQDNSIIALAGPNGSGKSTLLAALLCAPIYREVPFYDCGVQEFFHASGGSIEVSITLDKEYQITIRGSYGETPKCYLYDGQNTIGPGVREFAAAINELFPPKELMMAAYFSSQDSPRGFFTMNNKARSQVFSHLLGLNFYDKLIVDIKDNLTKNKKLLNIAEIEYSSYKNQLKESQQSTEALEKCKQYIENIKKEIFLLEEKQDQLFAAQVASQSLEKCKYQLSEKQNLKNSITNGNTLLDIASQIQNINNNLAQKHQSLLSTKDSLITKITSAKEYEKTLKYYYDTIRQYTENENNILDEIRRSNNALRDVNLDLEICKNCSLTKHHFDRHSLLTKAIHKRITLQNNNEKLISQTQDNVLNLNQEIEYHKSIIKQIQTEISELEKELILLTQRQNQSKNINIIDRDIECLQVELDELYKTALNYSPDQLKLISATLIDKKEELILAEKEYQELQSKIGHILYSEDTLNSLRDKYQEFAESRTIDKGLLTIIQEDRRNRIDIICPQIELLANNILSEFMNGRFRIALNTAMPKKSDPDQIKENFTPTIIDQLQNNTRFSASGGEGTILSEALRMAISIVNAEYMGIPGGTLLRDEVTGSLDENALDIYLHILRYGMNRGIFKNVIFSTHSSKLIDKADYIISMKDGGIIDVR